MTKSTTSSIGPARAEETIRLARKNLGNGAAMESSARLCLADAVALFDAQRYADAHARALKALSYSVGILHADYARASRDFVPGPAFRRDIDSGVVLCKPCLDEQLELAAASGRDDCARRVTAPAGSVCVSCCATDRGSC